MQCENLLIPRVRLRANLVPRYATISTRQRRLTTWFIRSETKALAAVVVAHYLDYIIQALRNWEKKPGKAPHHCVGGLAGVGKNGPLSCFLNRRSSPSEPLYHLMGN